MTEHINPLIFIFEFVFAIRNKQKKSIQEKMTKLIAENKSFEH